MRYTVEPPNKGHFGNGFFVLFGGCPYLGGSPYFDIIIISTMFKVLWMNFMLSVGGEIVM